MDSVIENTASLTINRASKATEQIATTRFGKPKPLQNEKSKASGNAKSDSEPINDYKVRVCRYFGATGKCSFGDKCRFAHIRDSSSKSNPVSEDSANLENSKPESSELNEKHKIINKNGLSKNRNSRNEANRQGKSASTRENISQKSFGRRSEVKEVENTVSGNLIKNTNDKGVAYNQPKHLQVTNGKQRADSLLQESTAAKKRHPKNSNSKSPRPNFGRGPKNSRKPIAQEKVNLVRDKEIEYVLSSSLWASEILEDNKDETAIVVKIKPFSKDFPYDLDELRLALVVPKSYLVSSKHESLPEIYIANNDIPVGIKENIQTEFRKQLNQTNIPENSGDDPTLHSLLTWLGNNLEHIFSMKPSSTIKFVSFNDKQITPSALSTTNTSENENENITKAVPKIRTPVVRPTPKALLDNKSAKSQEKSILARNLELNQLQRRFKDSYEIKNFLFDGKSVINVKLELTDPEIPIDVTSLTIKITVPTGYPGSVNSQQPGTIANPLLSPIFNISDEKITGAADKPSSWHPAEGRRFYLCKIEKQLNSLAISCNGYSLLKVVNWLDRHFTEILDNINKSVSETKNKIENVSCGLDLNQPTHQDSNILHTKPAFLIEANPNSIDDKINGNHDKNSSGLSADIGSKPKVTINIEKEDDFEPNTSWPIRRGIEMKFGAAAFNNVLLVMCKTLQLSVKCGKCKATSDFNSIIATTQNTKDNQKWTTCTNCGAMMGVRFRASFLYPEMPSLGFLDVSNCSPIDLKPSIYQLSCSKCSDDYDDSDSESEGSSDDSLTEDEVEPQQGAISGSDNQKLPTKAINERPKIKENGLSIQNKITNVRNKRNIAGDKNNYTLTPNVKNFFSCVTCHARMLVSLDDFIFSKLTASLNMGGSGSAAQIQNELAKFRQGSNSKIIKKVDTYGLVLGTPLPKKGTCKHYSKSFRWFRFSCCMNLYPCDLCHNAKEDHFNEVANLIVCGYCSKEQRVQKAEILGKCINCDENIVKKKVSAFWEGGKGVRNRKRMSRNDSRKYKGLNKTISNKKVGSNNKSKESKAL